MPDPGPDRVAAVVARVERMAGPRGTYPKRVLPYLVKALDAAGLLLTEERRKRLRDHLSVLRPVLLEARLPKTCEMHDALLRELAGDGGSGVEVPTVITTAPRRMAANPGALIQPRHMTEHEESTWCQLAVPPCQPVAAAGTITAPVREDDFYTPRKRLCATCGEYQRDCTCDDPPAHEHRWTAVAWESSGGAYSRAKRVTREHCTRGDCTATREVGHGA